MPSTPTPELADWWKVFGAAFALVAVTLMGWFKSYIEAKKEGPAAAGEVAGKAVGAAIVDQAVSDEIATIAEDTHEIRDILERRERVEDQARAIELAELRRIAGKKAET